MCGMSEMVNAEVVVTYASWKLNVKPIVYTWSWTVFSWILVFASTVTWMYDQIWYRLPDLHCFLQSTASQISGRSRTTHFQMCGSQILKGVSFYMEHFRCIWLKGNFTVTLPSWDTCILTIQVVVSGLVGTTWVLMEFRPPRVKTTPPTTKHTLNTQCICLDLHPKTTKI